MPTVPERIAHLRAQSTPQARETMRKYADVLHDPELLDRLEKAPRPLTHADVLNAVINAVLRQRPNTPHADSGENPT